MIRLIDNPLHKFVRIETINLETSDWIFGCAANEIDGMKRFCTKGVSLTQYVTTYPSLKNRRMIFMMDLQKLRMKNHLWTHLVIRMTKTDDPFKIIVDIHDPADRTLTVSMPKWYSFTTEKLLEDTLMGSSIYHLKIKGKKLVEITQRGGWFIEERFNEFLYNFCRYGRDPPNG